jgi:hypothetical protein
MCSVNFIRHNCELHLLYVVLMLSFTICVSAFGIDDVFSYKYNQKLGNCGEDGLAISCEFGTCHVVPVSFVSPRHVFLQLFTVYRCFWHSMLVILSDNMK